MQNQGIHLETVRVHFGGGRRRKEVANERDILCHFASQNGDRLAQIKTDNFCRPIVFKPIAGWDISHFRGNNYIF